ncbi:MAG: 3-keto-disaccharide hydrolase, partial [Thermogutta sp.]
MKTKHLWGVFSTVWFLVAGSLATAEDGWITIPIEKGLPGWKLKGATEQSKWAVGTAAIDPADPRSLVCRPGGNELVNVGSRGVDIFTEQTFGDAIIELEVMVPQGSNSGIYVMGEYEIQILDSFGKEKLGMGDMGAVYSMAVPKVNACKKPGEWQKYVIEYRAPRFDATGTKIANGRLVKVILNDQVIHENLELKSQTPGGVSGKEAPRGPLMFQGNHGPVAYRNIRI